MNLRDYERESIRAFVHRAADDGYLSGRVLDYGCGKQPYRDIVEAAGGEDVGYDHESFPAHVGDFTVGTNPWHSESFDTILCTQVLQYVRFYRDERYTPPLTIQTLLGDFRYHAKALVLTYPTNWPEVEPEDLHRFTKAGMERLLTEAGFTIIRHERRGTLYDPRFPSGREKRITALGDEFAIGYGVICRA